MRRPVVFFLLLAGFLMAQPASRAATIAFVYGGTAPNAGDQAVIDYLQSLGNTVTTVADTAATPTNPAGANMWLMSETVSSTNVRNKGFETMAVPLMFSETANTPDFLKTPASASTPSTTTAYINPTDSTNALAAGYSGSVVLYASPQATNYLPSPAPVTPYFGLKATATDTGVISVAFEAGTKMYDNATNAPAKRLMSFWRTAAVPSMTAAAWRLLTAQVYWCLGQPMPTMPPTISPKSYSNVTLKGRALTTTITVSNTNSTPLVVNDILLSGATDVFSLQNPQQTTMTIAGLQSGKIVLNIKSRHDPITTSTATLKVVCGNPATTLTASLRLVTTTFSREWADRDIGPVGLAGSAVLGGTITVTGSGADIWNSADQFHYLYQSAYGDFPITARTVSLTDSAGGSNNGWVKAGVMIRESLDANSRFVDVVATPTSSHGVSMQWRAATGGGGTSISVNGPTLPAWVRLVRAGDTYTGYWSADGVTWNTIGSATIPMNDVLFGGLAVTSHDNSKKCQTVFDNLDFNIFVNPVRGWALYE